MSREPLILMTPPERLRRARELNAEIAHRAYRLGQGPHLYRAGTPVSGGLMAVNDREFDGRGDGGALCGEILRECTARGFHGAVLNFEQGCKPVLERVIPELEEGFTRRKWTLYVPEEYAHCTQYARVMVSSALSGGSLHSRLEEGLERWGKKRLTLVLERVREDFFLPAPDGQGEKLDRKQLEELMGEWNPSVFFSHELCARYFTYMSRENGAHFVLFDDGDTIRKKIQVARGLGITAFMAALEDVEDIAEKIELVQEAR